MLDIKYIRNNPDLVKERSKNKGVDIDIDRLLKVEEKRRNLLQKIEAIKSKKNKANELIRETDEDEKKKIIDEMRLIDTEEDELQKEFKILDKEYQQLMSIIPNISFDNVPVGKDDSENLVIREEGIKREFDFNPKDYLSIAEELDIIDVKRAAKVSGSRFGYLKGDAVLLEFALIQLAMKVTIEKGFIPVIPPVMIKPEMMEKMGHIDKNFDNRDEQWNGEDVYFLKNDPLLLVGTSEQSIGPMHTNEVFRKEDLPKRYVGFSTCFRREAGSYGKDTKGILRVHQFDKIEMFTFCLPEESEKEHKLLLSIEEELMNLLGLPYRVVDICTGDLGLSAASKYDIEAWMPGQDQYRETHSTSNCTDFQARRLNIRYRDGEKNKFVHMLNGTAIAVGRILIAIIENYQRENGSFDVPEVLVGYVGKKTIGK